MLTLLALTLNVFLLMASYRVANGNAALNLIASFVLTVIVTAIMPEAHGLPFAGYLSVWLIHLVGLQLLMPMADGKVTVHRLRRTTGIRFGRVMVAIAVA